MITFFVSLVFQSCPKCDPKSVYKYCISIIGYQFNSDCDDCQHIWSSDYLCLHNNNIYNFVECLEWSLSDQYSRNDCIFASKLFKNFNVRHIFGRNFDDSSADVVNHFDPKPEISVYLLLCCLNSLTFSLFWFLLHLIIECKNSLLFHTKKNITKLFLSLFFTKTFSAFIVTSKTNSRIIYAKSSTTLWAIHQRIGHYFQFCPKHGNIIWIYI